MSLSNKQLDSIQEGDLQDLIGKDPERKIIEYKQSLSSNSHEDKREFLADVSSFANAAGGHLIYGIREESGIPIELCGLQDIDADAQILRLENIIRDCIEPRIPGIHMRAIPLQTSGVAIIIRIPRSWALPHVVKFEKHWRFYSRNSAGKYPLDVSELRAAFALSETTTERIRNFRMERLSKIVAGETPIALNESAKIVLHIIPFSAFDPAARFDVSALVKNPNSLKPTSLSEFIFRYNFDGLLSYSRPPKLDFTFSYLQIFRNGIIEAVDTYILAQRNKTCTLDIGWCEAELLEALPRFLSNQENLGIEPPFIVMVSLLGVFGYSIPVPFHYISPDGTHPHPIDRETLLIPEIIIEGFDFDPSEVMRPIFDAIWNAAGWPHAMNYDSTWNGKG
jgi:schlafen family protein